MQKIKKLLILLLIIFLSSCKRDFPAIKIQVRCVNVLLDEKIIEGVSYHSGYCRCHLYEFTSEHIGKVGESIDYDSMKCDKLVGFDPDTFGTIYMWWESIRLWLNRQK